MKVEKTGKTPPVTSVREAAGRTSAAKTGSTGAEGSVPASGATSSGSTNVHLGETSSQLQGIVSSLAGSPVVDAAKVAEIKQAISEGKFQVNAGVVADRLIASVNDLVNSRQH